MRMKREMSYYDTFNCPVILLVPWTIGRMMVWDWILAMVRGRSSFCILRLLLCVVWA